MSDEEFQAVGPAICGDQLYFRCKTCGQDLKKRRARVHLKSCLKCTSASWQSTQRHWVLVKDANRVSNRTKTHSALKFEAAYRDYEASHPTTAPPPPLQDNTHDSAPHAEPPPPLQYTAACPTTPDYIPSPHTPPSPAGSIPSPHTPPTNAGFIPSPRTPPARDPSTPRPPHCSSCGASCLYCEPTAEFLQYLELYAAATPPPQSTPPRPPNHPSTAASPAPSCSQQEMQEILNRKLDSLQQEVADVSSKVNKIDKAVEKVDCEAPMPDGITIKPWVWDSSLFTNFSWRTQVAPAHS